MMGTDGDQAGTVLHTTLDISTAVIPRRLMTFYRGLGGIVGLVERHVGCFYGIFVLIEWSQQSVRVKQLLFCEGKVLKLMRFHHCIL